MAVAERTFEPERARAAARDRAAARALALPLVEAAIALAIFGTALLVYNATLTPSLSYVSLDGNELATIPYQLGLAHPTGYPLYTWVGKIFTYLPVGDVAHRTNLMSAFGAAGGSALLFGIIVMVVRRSSLLQSPPVSTPLKRLLDWLPLVAAAIGALTFAFSRTLWSQAVISEVYAPNVFMVGLSFALLLVWGGYERHRLVLSEVEGVASPRYGPDTRSLTLFGAFALAFGLSLGTHMSDLALAPGFIAYILLTNWRLALQPKFVLAGALGFGLGVLQFAWLPYKASLVNDAAVARNTPNDLQGIYNYTLHAFPQLQWSFPWSVVPDRMVMYMDFMRENFRLPGVALAAIGGLAMTWRHPRAFFLFAPAYIFQGAFFIEYRASDIDVFFITAHFMTAVFIGYGAWILGEGAVLGLSRLSSVAALRQPIVHLWAPRIALAAAGLVAAFVLAQPALTLARNWSTADQSDNTGINDFYDNVFATLPANSTLIGRGGVFGYDMFYWRYVYNVRPDVTIPLAVRFDNISVPSGSSTFSITPPGGQGGFGGPSPAPRGLQSQSAWYWPVMSAPVVTDETAALELQHQLTLFESKSQAPQMFVSGVTPGHEVNYSFGGVTLVGYDVSTNTVAAGGTMHLKLYWQTNGNATPQVETKVGDTRYFEAHQLGFGNLSRYIQTYGQPSTGSLLVEDYDLVVLSSLGSGTQPFYVRLGSSGIGQSAGASAWIQIGSVEVK
jgi:hypothetical protein